MAQNRFIRPLSTEYHDFTEKQVNETEEEVPLKFRAKPIEERYVKKPKR